MALRIALSAFTLVTLVAVGVGGAGLQSAPPTGGGGGGDCSSLVLNMADCLSYVTNGSKVEKPEGGCCSGLKTVLKTNAECLCEGFKSSSQFGVVLNVTKALQLPDACHVKAPSASSCGLSLTPAGAPGPAGSSLPPSVAGAPSSSIANAPSMGASETVPTPAPMKAGSSALRSSMGSILWAMAAAAFFSFTAF